MHFCKVIYYAEGVPTGSVLPFIFKVAVHGNKIIVDMYYIV